MFVHDLSEKVSDTIDDLGKLLDILHKFPQQQRKLYFDKIQTLKNQMLSLRNNLKQSNALQTERQYNSLFVTVNTLKHQIEDQNSMLANKENRNNNCSRITRENKNNHEDALRLIAQKEENIGQLRLVLFQKEQLIKINYQELRDYKRQCSTLYDQNKMLKVDLTQLEKELCTVNQHSMRIENEVSDLKIQKQQLEWQLRNDNDALSRFSAELTSAKEKLHHFQSLANISVMKADVVEENIRKVELSAANLNQNYKIKEEQGIKKDKIIQQLRLDLIQMNKTVQYLSDQNDKSSNEIQMLESQLSQLQKHTYDLRVQNRELKQSYNDEIKKMLTKNDEIQLKFQQKKQQLEDLESKFMDIYNKNSNIQQEGQILIKEIDSSTSSLRECQMKLNDAETVIGQISTQKQNMIQQKIVLEQFLSQSKSELKDRQNFIIQLQQRIKVKQQEKVKLSSKVDILEIKVKQNEKNKLVIEQQQLSLAKEISILKKKSFLLQQKNRSYERTITDLKKRLLRSKIEVINEIRNTVSE